MRKAVVIFGRESKAFLLFLDILVMMACFSLASFIRFGEIEMSFLLNGSLYALAIAYVISLYVFSCYDLDVEVTLLRMGFNFFVATSVFFVFVISLIYLLALQPQGLLGRGILISALAAFGFIALLLRLAILKVLRGLRAKARWLFVVSDNYYGAIVEDINSWGLHGQVHILVAGQDKIERTPNGLILGSIDDLQGYLTRKWNAVIIALRPDEFTSEISHHLVKHKLQGEPVLDLVSAYEKFWRKLPEYYLEPTWFLKYQGLSIVRNPSVARVKRIFDIGLAALLLLITWPVVLLFAVLIRLESTGSPWYRQIRTGKGGRDFWIYKLRSMTVNAEQNGAVWARENDSRVTAIGRFIRKTRIDELPQLVNVLKGDMSFVGPRPERPEFNTKLEAELPYYSLRHLVHPGITGWAQVRYPYGASIRDAQEKLQHELFYIKNFSFFLDLKIVLRTVRVVVFGSGR
ncbi:exopolysaccharide biosynthesis polyprenyl glycosylphosphotransferase [Bdellovibrio sp. HCB209]|uniref:exopolysaccharide biosynthesis polyprenyl glycosylphosphotransferase n=1 Tax=Bdellovibrio sp. HCB209 TaxID=3394354 RepID=UPI0039B4593C